MSSLRHQLDDLVGRTVENNLWRQRRCFNLIPSEQTPSLLAKLFEIADPAGRYAEHRRIEGRDVYYYQGIEFIREIEEECRAELARYLECTQVELRPISGQMANEVVFKALVRFLGRRRRERGGRLHAVLNNDLRLGGHLSAQPMGGLFNFVRDDPRTGSPAVQSFAVREDNPYRTDVERTLEALPRLRPDVVIFGKSMFLYPEPVREVHALVADWEDRPVLMYDMAHVLGLYGAFQSPFDEGADVVTGSTHETFFGSQRGLVAANLSAADPLSGLWVEIENRAFPGSTSNHHLGTLLSLLAATYEMNAFRDDYQSQVRRNAKAFARALAKAGVDVEGDPEDGFTETHQVICRVRPDESGAEVAARLEASNIICNYQALPGDASFGESSGLRLGVAEMTRFGMSEDDFGPLAGYVADVVLSSTDVAEKVAGYRRDFREMRFCLDRDESCALGARLLASILPATAYGSAFAERLEMAAELGSAHV